MACGRVGEWRNLPFLTRALSSAAYHLFLRKATHTVHPHKGWKKNLLRKDCSKEKLPAFQCNCLPLLCVLEVSFQYIVQAEASSESLVSNDLSVSDS